MMFEGRQKIDMINKVNKYFENLKEEIFPLSFKNKCTLILSGSTGWGINEGFDNKADWDLHILLSNEDYEIFTNKFGDNYVLDDHTHKPIVFGQINNIDWLKERLESEETNILYLWIYTKCLYIKDSLCVEDVVKEYYNKFVLNKIEIIKKCYIKFAVRRLDTCSSAKRGMEIATGINRGEMVQQALKLLCLLKGQPYPYNKWLEKNVEIIYKENENVRNIVGLCKECLMENQLNLIIIKSKKLRDEIEKKLISIYGRKRWIIYWWEYNKN